MSKRVAAMLRGHARLLEDVIDKIGQDWPIEHLGILLAVVANLRRDAVDEEERGRQWNKQRKAELKAMGIPEGERKSQVPPRQEPWF